MKEKKSNYRGFWKYIKRYMRAYYKNLAIAMLLAMAVGIFVAAQPLVIKYIVDDGISNETLAPDARMKFSVIMCVVYILLAVMRVTVWRMALVNMLKSLESIIFNLRSHFFSHVQHMCMRFYESTSVGELFNCIMGSPMVNIKTYMEQIFIMVPYQVVSFVISLVALLSFDGMLTLTSVITAFFMAFISFLSRKKLRKNFKEYIQVESEASHYLNNTLSGMDAIKIYSIEREMFKTFKKFISDMYEKGLRARLGQNLANLKPELVQYIGMALIYFVGAYSCIYRGLSVGTLYAFLSSVGIIFSTLVSWMNLGFQKTSAEAGLHKILTILDTNTSTPEIDASHSRNVQIEKESAIKNNKPCIEFKDVCFGYDERIIFEKLNCSIKYNESVALVGTSGSGKSTITKLAMRLYGPNSGEVLLHGRDVKDFTVHNLRTTFGVVPQNPFIFYGSVWDNVQIARPNATNKEVMHAMEIAHVHEFANELEKGWNTIVGDGALGLSGGQKQRIAIARAVLGNPDVLIFDEATSALDNISEKHIQQAMEELMKTHTVIIVAHRLSTIRNVDRIMVFDKGEIIQEGSYDELANTDGKFKELLNTLN